MYTCTIISDNGKNIYFKLIPKLNIKNLNYKKDSYNTFVYEKSNRTIYFRSLIDHYNKYIRDSRADDIFVYKFKKFIQDPKIKLYLDLMIV